MRQVKLSVLLLGLLFLSPSRSSGQEPGARDMWLTSRTSTASTTTAARPKPTVAPKKKDPTPKAPSDSAANLPPALGLGYTLFLKNEAGDDIRINPVREFRSGNEVRLLVESNRDGYLYILHQENDSPPVLLFPDWKIQNGENRIRAHEPLWVPSRGVIAFDQNSAVEKFVLVMTEDPIGGLPSGEELKSKERVEVSADLFQLISKPTQLREDAQLREGAKLTEREGRGVKLKRDDPAPAFILMNQVPQERRITARINLSHR